MNTNNDNGKATNAYWANGPSQMVELYESAAWTVGVSVDDSTTEEFVVEGKPSVGPDWLVFLSRGPNKQNIITAAFPVARVRFVVPDALGKSGASADKTEAVG